MVGKKMFLMAEECQLFTLPYGFYSYPKFFKPPLEIAREPLRCQSVIKILIGELYSGWVEIELSDWIQIFCLLIMYAVGIR